MMTDYIDAIKQWCNSQQNVSYVDVNSRVCAERVYNLVVNGVIYSVVMTLNIT
jgi:hypothetical protein